MNEQKLHEIFDKNAFAQYIGMELLEVKEGMARGRIALQNEHMNIYQGMHGGCTYALADTLAGIAAASYGKYVTTVSGSMNYMLPVQNTKYVNCVAKAVRQGNKVGIYEIEVTGDAGELFANGSFTYYRLKDDIKDMQ